MQGTAGYPAFSFIGGYLPSQFSFKPQQLLSDRIVGGYNGTACGGPNWAEYLTGCGLGDGLHDPAQCPIQLWDFAFAGADTTEELLPLHHNYTVPLVNQTQQYLTYAEPVIGHHMDKTRALVAIWIGINDINDAAGMPNVTYLDFYDATLDIVFDASVQTMYDAGYRHFLFVNLPPLDRTPSAQQSSNPNPNATMINQWNSALAAHKDAWARKHDDATALLYDVNSFLNGVMDHPQKYGITNTTGFCGSKDPQVLLDPERFGCVPLREYFWFDAGHISSRAHEVMVEDLRPFLRGESERYGSDGGR